MHLAGSPLKDMAVCTGFTLLEYEQAFLCKDMSKSDVSGLNCAKVKWKKCIQRNQHNC